MVNSSNPSFNDKSNNGFQGVNSNQIIPGDYQNNNTGRPSKSWCCFF